jgi:Fe-S-cluster containining protein
MGKNSVRFRCHSCGHCCTDVVCLPTPWDIIRIIRETDAHPDKFLEFLTPEEIAGVDTSDPTWLKVGDERYMMALRRGEKGCHFLNKRSKRCTIYESRPILCRLYPLQLQETRDGEFKGFRLHNHKDVLCPKHTDGTMATQPLYELYKDDAIHHEDYDKLVAFFNKQDYEGKKPQHFVNMFVVKKGKAPEYGQPVPSWAK